MSKVLILGSSYIAKSVVSYLSQFHAISVTVGKLLQVECWESNRIFPCICYM